MMTEDPLFIPKIFVAKINFNSWVDDLFLPSWGYLICIIISLVALSMSPLNCGDLEISGTILLIVVGIHNANWKRMKNMVVEIINMVGIALFGYLSLIFLTNIT